MLLSDDIVFQVHRLLAIFKPIGLSQPTPQHIEETRHPRIVEDRRELYDYEERRVPQHVEERGGVKERKNTVMEYQEKRKVLNRNMRISKE